MSFETILNTESVRGPTLIRWKLPQCPTPVGDVIQLQDARQVEVPKTFRASVLLPLVFPRVESFVLADFILYSKHVTWFNKNRTLKAVSLLVQEKTFMCQSWQDREKSFLIIVAFILTQGNCYILILCQKCLKCSNIRLNSDFQTSFQLCRISFCHKVISKRKLFVV